MGGAICVGIKFPDLMLDSSAREMNMTGGSAWNVRVTPAPSFLDLPSFLSLYVFVFNHGAIILRCLGEKSTSPSQIEGFVRELVAAEAGPLLLVLVIAKVTIKV